MANWKNLDEKAMRAAMEKIEDRERQEAIWNSFCENCREPLSGGMVWIERHASEPDGEAEETFYCPRCISVDRARSV